MAEKEARERKIRVPFLFPLNPAVTNTEFGYYLEQLGKGKITYAVDVQQRDNFHIFNRDLLLFLENETQEIENVQQDDMRSANQFRLGYAGAIIVLQAHSLLSREPVPVVTPQDRSGFIVSRGSPGDDLRILLEDKLCKDDPAFSYVFNGYRDLFGQSNPGIGFFADGLSHVYYPVRSAWKNNRYN